MGKAVIYILGMFICLIALTPFLHLHGMAGGGRQPSRRNNDSPVVPVAEQPTRMLANLSPILDNSYKENHWDGPTNSGTTTSIQTT